MLAVMLMIKNLVVKGLALVLFASASILPAYSASLGPPGFEGAMVDASQMPGADMCAKIAAAANALIALSARVLPARVAGKRIQPGRLCLMLDLNDEKNLTALADRIWACITGATLIPSPSRCARNWR